MLSILSKLGSSTRANCILKYVTRDVPKRSLSFHNSYNSIIGSNGLMENSEVKPKTILTKPSIVSWTSRQSFYRTISTCAHQNQINKFGSAKHMEQTIQVPEIFTSRVDDEKKARILKLCQAREERVPRQKALFDEYMNGVQYSTSSDQIMLKDMCKKHNLIAPSIMSWLYFHGLSVTGYKDSNPFNLPDQRIVASTQYDPKSDKKWYDEYENLTKIYQSDLQKDQSDGLERFFLKEHKYIILKKGDNYDYAQLELKQDNEDENESAKPRDRDAIRDIVFVEQKRPSRHFDSLTLGGILKMIQGSNNYVGKIGNIGVFNNFDESHVYSTRLYNEAYGQDAFDNAIIGSIDLYLKTDGDASIRYQRTSDLITATVTKLCNGDMELMNKLCRDFVDNTTHGLGDTQVEIGRLMDLYNIESHELLYVMYTANLPFGAGIFEYASNKEKADSFTLETAQQTLVSHDYCIDYLNGKPIKNWFRKNRGEKQEIRIHKYDSRTQSGHFYRCIMWLMGYKLTQKKLGSAELQIEGL